MKQPHIRLLPVCDNEFHRDRGKRFLQRTRIFDRRFRFRRSRLLRQLLRFFFRFLQGARAQQHL